MEFVLKVESTMAMQNLQSKIKAIQQRYTGNQSGKNTTRDITRIQAGRGEFIGSKLFTNLGYNTILDRSISSSFQCGKRGIVDIRFLLDPVLGWANNHCCLTKWIWNFLAYSIYGWTTTIGLARHYSVPCFTCPPCYFSVCFNGVNEASTDR